MGISAAFDKNVPRLRKARREIPLFGRQVAGPNNRAEEMKLKKDAAVKVVIKSTELMLQKD
jgi:hypothetical protein